MNKGLTPLREVEWNKETYTFTKKEFSEFIEWCRVNGERHRGNLQKNGVELYKQYLIEKGIFQS